MRDRMRCELVSIRACIEEHETPGKPAYLYHVTSAPNAARIALMGFKRSPQMFAHGGYSAYSRGGVFLTEQSGLPYWLERVEDQLFHSHDDPPPVAVVRVPFDALSSRLTDDVLGRNDARASAWRVDLGVCERLWQASHPDGTRCWVDGTALPRFNHLDRPIADSEADLRRFWRWFRGSVATDAAGRPLVVYHGTSAHFSTLTPHMAPLGRGVYFTDAFPQALSDGARVVSAYLSLRNPAALVGDGSAPRRIDGGAFDPQCDLAEHDGLVLRPSENAPLQYMVTSAEQIRICADNRDPLSANGSRHAGTRAVGMGA